MNHRIIFHREEDNVGVVVQDVQARDEVIGIYMDTNNEIVIICNQDISLGHKIASNSIGIGEPIIEYGEKIGIATTNIVKGDWVHIHNIKSGRW